MERKSYWSVFFAVLLLGFLVSPGWAARAIKVGIVDCYSGPPSTYTNDVRDAFQMEIDKINAAGGVLGRRIEFVTRDSKFKVDIGLSAARELIMRENVDLLMGTINSALALAVSDLCRKEKIPFLVTFAKSAKITGARGNRYVFSLTENTVMAGKAGALGLAKKPFKRYWIAGDDYEYGHAIADAVWTNLKKLRPQVKLVGKSWWKVGEPDFTPYITAIMAARPDAVIVATGGRDCVPFLKAAKATGLNRKIPFYMHTAVGLSTLKPLGLDAPEGVLGTTNYFFYYPKTPANESFVREFRSRYHRYPATGAVNGYLAAHFIAAAYRRAGKVDAEKFVDALAGLTVSGPIGEVTIRRYDHQAMVPMFMGVTKKVPGYDFLIADDIVTIPGHEVMPDIAEIMKARGQK